MAGEDCGGGEGDGRHLFLEHREHHLRRGHLEEGEWCVAELAAHLRVALLQRRHHRPHPRGLLRAAIVRRVRRTLRVRHHERGLLGARLIDECSLGRG